MVATGAHQLHMIFRSTCRNLNNRANKAVVRHVSSSLTSCLPISLNTSVRRRTVFSAFSFFPVLHLFGWRSTDPSHKTLGSSPLGVLSWYPPICDHCRRHLIAVEDGGFSEARVMGRLGSNQRTYSANSDDYKLLEEVGYGASAIVYRAIYIPFNEVIAVKCLDLDRCNSNLVLWFCSLFDLRVLLL